MNCERERFIKIRSGLQIREKIFHITYEEAKAVACEPYLTNDMKIAIRNEDVKGFGALVSRLTSSNPEGTVARRDPGWEELFVFEFKFEEYLELKSKNVKTEDMLKELYYPVLHNRIKR